MPDRLSRVRRAVSEHPWAVIPETLDIVLEVIERRIFGVDLSAEEKASAVAAARRVQAPASAPGSIAVIPVFGVLANRMHMFANVSQEGTSTEGLTLALRQAAADPSVAAIVLDVDSPGGSVFGVQELADAVTAARERKPVVAVANSLAASAAYWVASQADELVVAPGGQVGSIGVLAVHDDVSKAAELAGVRRTYVTAGKYKAEGNAYAPLDDEARNQMQQTVDVYFDRFVRAVAAGRRVSLTAVREQFGQGRLVVSSDAVARGMADREETLQQTIDRLVARQEKASRAPRAVVGMSPVSARLRIAELEGA